MGLFRSVKNTFKKSEAAVVVQNLLEIQSKIGMLDINPATTANQLINAVWSESPHLFDGRFGQRPHKLSIAAVAFARAISRLSDDDPLTLSFMMALGKIMNEVSVNGRLYPFNSVDEQLLDKALGVFTSVSNRFEQSPLGQEVNHLLSHGKLTWEEWISQYKDEAGKHNPGLATNEKGFSLIDMMDDEPLRRAFRDGIEPKGLGRKFALQFDPLKMGMK
ncbi:hypothetical protein [Paracoccus sp. SSK6]|uniref:hypothetical protein n=1 Tax=Paracoccus sp. SSK6 TaxID=3143131 RepID=UPI003218F23A